MRTTGRLLPMKLSLRSLSFAVLACISVSAFAWIDTGHMVVAAIARKNLRPEVLAKVDALLKIGGDDKTQDMLGAACWADDVKRDRKETGPWHYSDQHFRTDGKTDNNQPDKENVVWAIDRFRKELGDPAKSEGDRAEALRWLLHFVGDIHQPLHTVAHDSDQEPNGDKGGNDFKIISPASMSDMARPLTNLHILWDFSCGLYRGTERPLTQNGLDKINGLADEISKEFPESSMREARSLDTGLWMKEGLALAKSDVYNLTPNTAPSEEYMKKGQEVCKRRLALAGYRLARLLNSTLK